jgi:DCN1-like protein 1/2
LNKIFDSLRNDDEDEKDTLAVGSCMNYFQNVCDLEEASFFIALEIVQAPRIGEITRDGFVNGWKATPANTTIEAQKQHISNLRASMSSDRDHFRKVYRNTFVCGKEPEQRALALETALVYWEMLFSDAAMRWVGRASGINWLDEWKSFLHEKWTRSVSRDMWNQTYEFAVKSIDDETLGFWNEDGAWPGVIDDFVAWYRAKNAMDVDA